jgi:hypothetical protein
MWFCGCPGTVYRRAACAVAAGLPCAVHSAGSRRPRPLRCAPISRRTLHIPSSPFASDPCSCSYLCRRCPPGPLPSLQEALPGRSPAGCAPSEDRLYGLSSRRSIAVVARYRCCSGIRGLMPALVPQVSPHHVRGLGRRLEFPETSRVKISSQRDFFRILSPEVLSLRAKGGGGIARMVPPFSSPYIRPMRAGIAREFACGSEDFRFWNGGFGQHTSRTMSCGVTDGIVSG